MTKRSQREFHKRCMRRDCTRLGLAIPENATKKQLEAVLDDYYKEAVVVHTDNGVDFRQTDKPTAEYIVDFSIDISHSIRAESAEAARKWIEEEAFAYYEPGIGEVVESIVGDIYNVYKAE